MSDYGLSIGTKGKISADGTEIGSWGKISTSFLGALLHKIIRLYSTIKRVITFNIT